jgi:hypothetical protein
MSRKSFLILSYHEPNLTISLLISPIHIFYLKSNLEFHGTVFHRRKREAKMPAFAGRRLHIPKMSGSRGSNFVRPRDPAKYIAVKDRGQTFYFEISRTGSLIPPPEFANAEAQGARSPDECALSACMEPPSSRSHHGFEFVGFLDASKLTTRSAGYSISDLLARPFVALPPPFPLLV